MLLLCVPTWRAPCNQLSVLLGMDKHGWLLHTCEVQCVPPHSSLPPCFVWPAAAYMCARVGARV